MREFVANHPAWTQFLVLLGVVILTIPIWGVAWYVIAEVGRMVIDDGCRARNYSCEYEGATFVITTLVILPFFIYFFIFLATKISGLITNRLLTWAGLDPEIALR